MESDLKTPHPCRYHIAHESYSDVYKKETWFTFGWEAGGNPLLINENGNIAIGNNKTVKEEYEVVASSFSEFLNEVLMGQKLASLFLIDESEHREFYEEERYEFPWINFLIKPKVA